MSKENKTHKDWTEFSKRAHPWDRGFYAVIDQEGHWVDSAATLENAVVFASAYYGEYTEDGGQALEHLGLSKYSIIHSRLLRPLWEADAIR
jgi:hypothetical protein